MVPVVIISFAAILFALLSNYALAEIDFGSGVKNKRGTIRHSLWMKLSHKAYMENVRFELMVNLHDLKLISHQWDDCPYCKAEAQKVRVAEKHTSIRPKRSPGSNIFQGVFLSNDDYYDNVQVALQNNGTTQIMATYTDPATGKTMTKASVLSNEMVKEFDVEKKIHKFNKDLQVANKGLQSGSMTPNEALSFTDHMWQATVLQ